jgi:CRP/FNR family transcriptional regulator
LGFANDDAYAYSAEAVTHVGLCRFQRRKLEVLLRQHPKLEQHLLAVASNELVAAQEQMLLLGRKSAREKLASFLINLPDRVVRRGLPDNPIDLPMTRNDIGDYLGLTTETVSRVFARFKREGTIVDLPNRKVQVIDKDLLLQASEGS